MLELLTVIAIMVVLIGFLIVGVRHMMGSAGASATKVTLKSLQGMMAELETVGPLKVPGTWEWSAGTVNITGSNPNNLDFWKVPYRTSANAVADPLPTANVADGLPSRYGSPAVINTQIVMARLLAVKNNSDAMAKLPARGQLNLLAAAQKAKAGDPSQAAAYDAAITAIQSHLASSDRYPLLQDAWNNPIIFVPASGLGAAGATVGANGVVPTGALQTSGQSSGDATIIKTSPDGKGFFASAGPDGNFQTGDDNVYSFEQ